MKCRPSPIWVVFLIAAVLCLVFPPRRDTEQGRDREGIPSRRFLESDKLCEGSPTGSSPLGPLVARIDHEKLAIELLALGALAGAISVGLGCRCRIDPQS